MAEQYKDQFGQPDDAVKSSDQEVAWIEEKNDQFYEETNYKGPNHEETQRGSETTMNDTKLSTMKEATSASGSDKPKQDKEIHTESSTPPDDGGACYQNEETFTSESTEAGSTSSGSGSRQIDKKDTKILNDRSARVANSEDCTVMSSGNDTKSETASDENDTKSETASDEGSNNETFANSGRVAREISTEEGSTSSGSKHDSRTGERGERSASAEDATVGSSGDNDNKSESTSDGGSATYGNVQRVVRDSSTEEGSTSSGSKDAAGKSIEQTIAHNEKEARAQRRAVEETAESSKNDEAGAAATRVRQGIEINVSEDSVNGSEAADSNTKKVGRVRRKNSELKKEFVCQYHRCGRSYASNHARLLHYTLKHRRGSVFNSLQPGPVRPPMAVIRPGQVNYMPLQMVPPGYMQVHRGMPSMVVPGQVIQMVRPMVRGVGQPIIIPQSNLLIPSRPLTHAQQPRAPVPATAQVKGASTPKAKPQSKTASGAGVSKSKASTTNTTKKSKATKEVDKEKLELEAKLQAEHQAQVKAQAKAQVIAQAQAQVQAQAQAETARSKAQSRIQSHVQNQAWEQAQRGNADFDLSSSDDSKSSSNSDKVQLCVPGGSNPFSSSSGASLESNEGGGNRSNSQGESSGENAQPFNSKKTTQKPKPGSLFMGQPIQKGHGLQQQGLQPNQMQGMNSAPLYNRYGNGFGSKMNNTQHLMGGLLKGHTGQSPGDRKEFYSGRAYPISSPKHHHAHPTDVFDDCSCQCARIARNGHGQCQGHVQHPMRGSHVHYRAKHNHLDAGSPPMQTDGASDMSFIPPSMFVPTTNGNGKMPMQYGSNSAPQAMDANSYYNHRSQMGQVNLNDANTGTTTSNSGGNAPVHFNNTTGSSEEDRSTPPSGGTHGDFHFHTGSHHASCTCSAHATNSDKCNDGSVSVSTSAYTRDNQNMAHHRDGRGSAVTGVSPPWNAQPQQYGRGGPSQPPVFVPNSQQQAYTPPYQNGFIDTGQQGQQGMHDKNSQHNHRRYQQLQALLQQQQHHQHNHQQTHQHQRQQLQQQQQQLVQQAQMQDVVGQLDGTTASMGGFNGKDMSEIKPHRQSSRTQARPEMNSEDRARSRSFPRSDAMPKADRKRSGSGHNKQTKSPSRKRSRSHPRAKDSPSVHSNTGVDANAAGPWNETLLNMNSMNGQMVNTASNTALGSHVSNSHNSQNGAGLVGMGQNQTTQRNSSVMSQRDGNSWARVSNSVPFTAPVIASNGLAQPNPNGKGLRSIDDECCTIHPHNANNHNSAQSSSDGNNGMPTHAGGGAYRGNTLNNFHGDHAWPAQNMEPQRGQFVSHSGDYSNVNQVMQQPQMRSNMRQQGGQNGQNSQNLPRQGHMKQGQFMQHNSMNAPNMSTQQMQGVHSNNMMMQNDYRVPMNSVVAGGYNDSSLHNGFRSSMGQDQSFQQQYHPYNRHGVSDLINSLENSSTDEKVSSNQYSNDSPIGGEGVPPFYDARYAS